MAIKVYNSLTKSKEEFQTALPGKVTMYVCGPTVYDLSHIGHARSAVSFDVIQKYLRYRGFEVKYARNYTDVDDKIIRKANQEGSTSEEVAERYIKAFDDDMAALNVSLPDLRPKATESIGKIIEVTKALMDNGYAYAVEGDVYYSVRKKKDYGKLSGKNIDGEQAGGAMVGEPLGQRKARLAHRVQRDGDGMARRDYRYPRRRKGPDIPAPRKRDSAERGRHRQNTLRQVLAPQRLRQHREREDEQVPGQYPEHQGRS